MLESFQSKFQVRGNWNISYIFGVITIIVLSILVIGVSITRRAIDPEALVNFRFMRELNLASVWIGETAPGHFVTYRPITGSLLRLEYLLFGLNPPAFFTVNVALLIILAILIFDIIYRASNEILPALVAALLLVTDWRLTPNVYVIGEVQITIAAIFGLFAVWIIWFSNNRYKPILVFLLLLMAALSKEYGLAFALGVFVYAILSISTRKKYAVIAVGAVVTYFILRLSLGIMIPTLGESANFNDLVVEYITNISSGFIFTFFNLFRPADDGDLPNLGNLRYTYAEAWQVIFLQILPIIIIFVLGFRKKSLRSLSIPLLFIILGNSFLLFWKYAFRFHFLSNVSMYTIAGLGLSDVFKHLRPKPRFFNFLMLIFMYAATLIFWRGLEFNSYLVDLNSEIDSRICEDRGQYSERERTICIKKRTLCIPTDEYYTGGGYHGYYSGADQDTVRLLMTYYDIPHEYCTCLDPNPTCYEDLLEE